MKVPPATITVEFPAWTAERLAKFVQDMKELKARIDAVEANKAAVKEEVYHRLCEVLQAHEEDRRADVQRGLLDLIDIFGPQRDAE